MKICSLALLLGAGAAVTLACSKEDKSAPSFSPQGNAGGASGRHGQGSGGTRSGQSGSGAGEAGGGIEDGGNAGQGSGGRPHGGAGRPGATAGVPNSGDIGADAGAAGMAGDSSGPGDGMGQIFIGPGGYATALGTRDEPFATLAQAAAVATSGTTIVYLDGNYAQPTLDEPVVIPDGVNVVADHPRGALLVGSGGPLLAPAGTTHVEGLRLSGFGNVLRAEAPGNVTITKCAFTACEAGSTSAVEVGGSAVVALVGDDLHDWGDCAAFGHVYGAGTLSVDAGHLHFTNDGGTPLLRANDDATLLVSNVNATDGDSLALDLRDNSSTTITQSTLATLAPHVVTLDGSAELELSSSELSLDPLAPSKGACVESTSTASLVLSHLLVHDCVSGVHGQAPATVLLDDVELYAMSESGVDFTGASPSTVTLEASRFHDLAGRAVRFANGVYQVTVRGTVLGNVPTGFELGGASGSSWDFGTLSQPGSNTLTASTTALALQLDSGATVSAVGNTWTPDEQGADGAGTYAAAGPGAALEVTSGSGRNYDDPNGTTLRLAENAP